MNEGNPATEPTPGAGHGPTAFDRLIFAFLWLLFGVSLAGAAVEWMFFDRSPWQGVGAALTIAAVIGLAARVKCVPAWPWGARGRNTTAE